MSVGEVPLGGWRAGNSGTSQLRNRLALTTILAVAPFLSYGRQAHAGCGVAPPFVCTGSETTTQTITFDNPDVITAPGFSVNAVAGDAITITGAGHLRFTDENASAITGADNGLSMRATGDAGATPGAITITANSSITGGDSGIDAYNEGSGDVTIIANGSAVGMAYDGITASNTSLGGDVTIRTGTGSSISGGSHGIRGDNEGTGDLVITVEGKVTASNVDGIAASTGTASRDLTITTGTESEVSGYRNGIDARSTGLGDLTITANGKVTAIDGEGIFANTSSDGKNLTITTGAASDVSGNSFGIRARNGGSGDLTITANGDVSGTVREGLYALNFIGSNDLTVTTAAGSVIKGGLDGIEARSLGSGALKVSVYGEVTGTDGFGIWVVNYSGTSATVTAGSQSVVTGFDGIAGRNDKGDFTITANGEVTGTDRHGIYARNTSNGADLKITTGVGSDIKGHFAGVLAENHGGGDLTIVADGKITGEGHYGIEAFNSVNGGNLTIATGAGSDIKGANDAINAQNFGGMLTVTVDGTAASTIGNGIMAINYSTASRLTVTTGEGSVVTGFNGIATRNDGDDDLTITVNGAATGLSGRGISAINYGEGETIIKIGAAGLAHGNTAGVYALSDAGQAIQITNDGEVRNFSGQSVGLAIDARGGATTIANNNRLIGRVSLSDFSDTLDNDGLWWTLGASFFGAATDSLNNRGVLLAASGIAAIENSYFDNLEFFNNSGVISLVDGLEGDQLGMGPATNYVGAGGRLVVDAFLAPGSPGKSDLFLISGNASGTTNLVVNLTNPIGSAPNTDGIRVAVVSGNTLEQDFQIEGGVLNAGFFAWDLRLVEEGEHELYTTGFGAGAYEFAAGITGAQDIWHQTTGTLLQRQADLRSLLAGTQVTPVADFSESVEPTPVGQVTPGLWFKGVGGYLERDQDVANNAVTDRNQEIYGLFAGFDFGSENAGEAWMFGLFGGYVTSNLDFTSTNTKWDYEGPSVGAYATYLNDAFYADLTVKADFLDIDIDAGDIAPAADNVDSDVFNLGGQIDAGYKVPLEHGLFVEPQASLVVLHTEVDDIGDVFGGSVDFEDETSVRGRLGLRLGHELTASNQLIYSSDITASVWRGFTGENDVTVTAPDSDPVGISDDPGDTFGDVAVGFSVQSPEGWSSFLRANYQFSNDYDAIAGNAGMRYAW